MTKWKIRVSFDMVVDGPDRNGPDDTFPEFHFEENHCVGNLIRQLYAEYTAHPNECIHCGDASVKLLGEASQDD